MRFHLSSSSLSLLATLAAALLVSSQAPAETTHVVGPGHTLAKIARRYHVSVEALREANDLVPGQKIKPGQRLVVPDGSTPAAAAAKANPPAVRDSSRDEERDSRRELRQARTNKTTSYARRPPHPGTVSLARGSEHWSGKTRLAKSRLAPSAADAFRRILRDESGSSHAIDPRLITLVTQLSDHFGGRTIEVVSGYRRHTETQYTAHSNHNVGRAIDFAVRGVPNEIVRDYCHTLSGVGVGYYPNSSFVHLDVRSTTTHWVDESGPGDPPRYTSITQGTASANRQAKATREHKAQGPADPEPQESKN